jgi:nucleotide-binding universal stress UspA family protein
MKILVCVDGSEYTRRMVAYWAAHEEWLSGHAFTVLTVVQALPPRAAAVLDRELLNNYYADEGDKTLGTFRTFLDRQGIAATYLSKTGPVAEVIARTAEEGAFDLIMMGSHGHSELGTLVMGSVSTRVLASCRTPVLLIR